MRGALPDSTLFADLSGVCVYLRRVVRLRSPPKERQSLRSAHRATVSFLPDVKKCISYVRAKQGNTQEYRGRMIRPSPLCIYAAVRLWRMLAAGTSAAASCRACVTSLPWRAPAGRALSAASIFGASTTGGGAKSVGSETVGWGGIDPGCNAWMGCKRKNKIKDTGDDGACPKLSTLNSVASLLCVAPSVPCIRVAFTRARNPSSYRIQLFPSTAATDNQL